MNLSLLTTALPNPHPAVTGFPLALLAAALALDLGCLVVRRHPWLDRAGTLLMTAGGVGLAAAYLTGRGAADSIGGVSGIARGVLADHEDLALLTVGAWAVAIALRILAFWLGRHDRRIHIGVYRLAAVVVALGAAALLILAAAHGYALVYEHAVGVMIQ
jgi:uncharacterized membrane protein